MVGIQAMGSSGAIAQKARKAARDRSSKAAPKSNTSKLAKASKEESYILSKLKENVNILDMSLKSIEKGIAHMPNEDDVDEQTDDSDESDESDLRKEGKQTKRVRSARRREASNSKYVLDPDEELLCNDTMQSQANSPWFEQFNGGYPCFHNLKIEVPKVDYQKLNQRLLEYTNQVFAQVEPLNASNLPLATRRECRKTSQHTNLCLNPLQTMRAWALLANVACNKTLEDLLKFVGQYTTIMSNSASELNTWLLAVHVAAEDDFDGCVRLFTELPFHIEHNVHNRRQANLFYGGKSQRAAIQHHAFSTDSDGLYSCYRINQETSLSTRGAIRYIVPEHCAPNWRASIVLSSAMDCTFFWKTDKLASETDFMEFRDSGGLNPSSICSGYLAVATIRVNGGVCRLDSWLDDVYLYLYSEDEKAGGDKKKQFKPEILATIASSDKWTPVQKRVLIPKATCSTPMSLYAHAKRNGLSRVFSSEKSELLEMKSITFEANGQFATLYDHFHKTNFEIVAHTPSVLTTPPFDTFAPERAHQCVEGNSLFAHFQKGTQRDANPLFTYYEDQLDHNAASMGYMTGQENVQLIRPQDDEISFNKPFYYIMTRKEGGEQVIVCAGYFNNTIWVCDQEPKKENRDKWKKVERVDETATEATGTTAK
ncbi:unnamed protein product [Caenorhabditis sp. 36 PRJEB53466]|nr:unnamed protein product [Caenorhabditis sp. 36 PRJEB53466]